MNLEMNYEFYSNKNTVEVQKEETVKTNEKMLFAQPSKSFLPEQTRNALKNFLQTTGVKQPKVMMISRKIQGQMIQELAFNVFRDDFPSQDALQHRLQQISWFLPRHYILFSLDRSSSYNDHLGEL